MTLPGWDSLNSVSRIQWWMEVAGFVFLGLCVVAEVIAFFYGNRKDALSEQATRKQIESVRMEQIPRRLSDVQKRTLIATLQPYQGQKVTVARILGDEEAEPLANDFVDVFVAAGCVFNEPKPGVDQSIYDKDPVGVEVTVNQVEAEANRMPAAAAPLVITLFNLGLVPSKNVFINPHTPSGLIELRVGKRPPK